jgi:hypothetical protein
MGRAKWVEKGLLGGPWGYVIVASEAFRTVSKRSSENPMRPKFRDPYLGQSFDITALGS